MIEAIEAPGGADDEKVATVDASRPHQYRTGQPDGPRSLSSFRFIDNMVRGLKNNYVTVLKFHKRHFSPSTIRMLQKDYKLSDFFIYEMDNFLYCYNFKLVSYERLVKIMRRVKSENLYYFLTRRHTYLPISTGRLVGYMRSDHGLDHPHSRPHCDLFSVAYARMYGAEKNLLGTIKVIA